MKYLSLEIDLGLFLSRYLYHLNVRLSTILLYLINTSLSKSMTISE